MDRNFLFLRRTQDEVESSPARGTWIEMLMVASIYWHVVSSPARGTWIEIPQNAPIFVHIDVVPRKGDVDRNV